MSGTLKTKDDRDFETAMETLFDSVSRAAGPVLVDVEGKGRMVVMPADTYADLLDRSQVLQPLDLETDPLLIKLRNAAASTA